jgi:hypothetical protein
MCLLSEKAFGIFASCVNSQLKIDIKCELDFYQFFIPFKPLVV